MSPRTATRGDRPSNRTRATAVAIGISTPRCAASPATTFEVPDTLGDLRRSGQSLVERGPAADPFRRTRGCGPCRENAVTARSPTPASPKNVARIGAPSPRPKARHLYEPAREDRGLRVVAVTEPVGDAGRERHDVLERPTQLDAEQVGIAIDAEGLRGSTRSAATAAMVRPRLRRRPSSAARARSLRRGSGRLSANTRSEEAHDFGDDRGRPLARLLLEALRERHERDAGRDAGPETGEHAAHVLRGHGDEHDLAAIEHGKLDRASRRSRR
jgi:hypothetical protein